MSLSCYHRDLASQVGPPTHTGQALLLSASENMIVGSLKKSARIRVTTHTELRAKLMKQGAMATKMIWDPLDSWGPGARELEQRERYLLCMQPILV